MDEEQYRDLRITNDFMFTRVMKNPEICKGFLEEVLPEIKISRLEYVEMQKTVESNVDARGIRLDVYVEDEDKVYNIEMQSVPQSGLARRARYYQSHIDMELIKKGEQYDTLKDCYIIFICTFDPFRKSHYVYTFKNTCQEIEKLKLRDGSVKLFLNTKGTKGPDRPNLKKVLDYFENKPIIDPPELVKKMEAEVREANQDKAWRREVMNLEMKLYDHEKLGIEKGRREGRQEGRQEEKREFVKNLLRMKQPIPFIQEATKLSEAEILKLKEELEK